jgi:hypothetical protein
MAKGRKPGKRANKTIRLSIPKRLYYILFGAAGNSEQKLNRLIRVIIEERLQNSSVAEIMALAEPKTREKISETNQDSD